MNSTSRTLGAAVGQTPQESSWPMMQSLSISSNSKSFTKFNITTKPTQIPAIKQGAPIIVNATANLPQFYNKCNSEFNWRKEANPRRVLTKRSKPALNDGFDNADGDYILYVNDILGSKDKQQYQILDILGQGTFGQVVKCVNLKTKDLVAVKVIKNKPAYYNQSLVEVAILDMLNNQHDPHDKHHIARMKDTFVHKSHLCITFEMLSLNLYELIKQSRFTGFSTNLVRVFMSQILDSLTVLARARIIHCDLKPENILLKSLNDPNIKVIDFGSACHEGQTLYTYIQSRFYRSPEVLLGLPYTSSIDMWSVGCIAAELFLGLPLFPGSSEYNQISRIVETLGVPPAHMIEKGKNARNFFDRGNTTITPTGRQQSVFLIKSMEKYMVEQKSTEEPSRRYFQGVKLEEIIMNHEGAKKGTNLSPGKVDEDRKMRIVFIDFLYGLLNLNPLERWSPQQAKLHPFVTGKPWNGPHKPTVAIPHSIEQRPPPSPSLAMGGPPSVGSDIKMSENSQVPGITNGTLQIPGSNGAVRTSRQRANTLSSSKVTTVPPTLQRLMQHTGGAGNARGLKHREKAQWSSDGRTSTGSDRTSPLPPGKREGDDGDMQTRNSKRFNEFSPQHPHTSSTDPHQYAGVVYAYPKNGTIPIPQLKIPMHNVASQLSMPAHSPTAAMMNSPINRHHHANMFSSSNMSEPVEPKLLIQPHRSYMDGPSSARLAHEPSSSMPPYTPNYGPSSAQAQFAYSSSLPFSSSYTGSAPQHFQQLSPRIGNNRASFSQPSPLSSSFPLTSNIPLHLRGHQTTPAVPTSNITASLSYSQKDIPNINVEVMEADGSASSSRLSPVPERKSPPPSWEWGSGGITSGRGSVVEKQAAPVLTPLQQMNFQSWKGRGKNSAGIEPMQVEHSQQRPWIHQGSKSPASASSLSPVVYGVPNDPAISGVAGGFGLMEIRSATQAPAAGSTVDDSGQDIIVDGSGFVRSRRASAPQNYH